MADALLKGAGITHDSELVFDSPERTLFLLQKGNDQQQRLRGGEDGGFS